MSVSTETVDKIQSFADKRRETEATYEQQPLGSVAIQAYNQKLDETLKQLQDRVKRQEEELNKLRASKSIEIGNANTNPSTRLSQVRRAKKAYDSLLTSETSLPDPASALPSLIALDMTGHLLKESKASILITAESLSADRQRLKNEEANLRDAQLITSGLEERIGRIRLEKSKKKEKSPSELAREQVNQQRDKNSELDRSADGMKISLDKFIDEKLAPMLAAEDLGGPIVGDALDVSDSTLEAGYTSHGRPKKQKRTDLEGSQNGQQRIDELVHRQRDREGQNGTRPTSKRDEAAIEMHTLLDALLESGSSYVDLPRDSAVSRFLVKAKVAQFHPRDARRLRLIDFGRSLDD